VRRAAAAVSDRQRRLLINTAVAGVYLVLAVLLFISTWRAPSTTYIGQGPDPIQQMWGIAWVPYAISHGLNPLYTFFLNAPTGTDILWSTPTAVVATVLWPVTALFGATVTYNVVMTLGLVLAAFFAFLVIRRWVFGGVVAAAVGGLLYGFSPYMTGQMIGHYNLVLSGVTPPLALMLADEILVRQRMRPVVLGLLGAGLAVVQFFIAQEILLTEALVGVLFAIVLAITHRDAVRGHAMFIARTLAVAVPPAIVVLAYPTWLQFFGADHVVTAGAIHGTDIYVTDPANFVVPTVAQLISPQVATNISSHFSGNASEWDAYLGIPLILVLLVATVRFWRVPQIRVAGVMALVIAILSLGPHINVGGHPFLALPLPWWIPAHLPVLDDILPNRLMMYVDLAAALILAFVLRAVWMLQARPLINVAVAAVVLLPLVPTLPTPATTLTIPAVFAATSQASIPLDANVLFEPFPSSDYSHAMAWQVAGGFSFSMVGGYIIGPYAPGADALQRLIYALTANAGTVTLTEAEREPLNIGLHTLRIGELVAGPGATPGVVSLFTQLSGSAPTEHEGFFFWPAPVFHG
jgi:membrane protein CcdC involved in cytochrome C biogenesis